jgi:hypothetical protein
MRRAIEANPVWAEMLAVTPRDGYRALARSARVRRAAYRTMFEGEPPRETIDTLRDATQGGRVPGREAPTRKFGAPAVTATPLAATAAAAIQ